MTVKRREIMTVRPPKKSDMVEKLMELAEKDGNRTLNNYVVMILQKHLDCQPKKSSHK